jgi:uncharacterized membrane protein
MLAMLLILLLCVGAGTIGGVFFGFSVFVMRALATIPPQQGIAAMQRINVVVINPLFLGVFFGTVVVAVFTVALELLSMSSPRSPLVVAAAALYVVGTSGVTLQFNVPRNNRLAHMATDSAEAAAYWPEYVSQWTRWNHVRTASAIASCACSAASLAS